MADPELRSTALPPPAPQQMRRVEDQPQTIVTKVKDRTLAVAFLSFSIAFLYQLSEILKRHSAWAQLQAPAGVGEILFALVCGLLAIGTALGLDLQSLAKGFSERST